MKSVRWASVSLVLALVVSGCAKKLELKMAVDVLSDPQKAQVKYKNKSLGEAPQSVSIGTFDDLQAISATSGNDNVVEKRIRILSPDKAVVIFRFGKEASPLAKRLGAAKLLVFEYTEKVSFDTGKFDLKTEARPILDKQKEILNAYFPNARVFVCGYTDSTGGDDLNLKLSLDRANAVTAYLVTGGVARGRLEPRGFGKEFPVDDNGSSSGRAANRRTEVVLPQ